MAKKSSKGKDKKLARKADNEKAATLQQQLRQLNEASTHGDLLAVQYPAFQRYERKGLAAQLRGYAAPHMPPALLDWALGLTRLHMRALYEACPDWGWSDAKKKAELADPAARYLVVFQQQQQGQQQQAQQQQQQEQQQQGPDAPALTAAAATSTLTAAAAAAAVPGSSSSPGQENKAASGNAFGGSAQQQAAGQAEEQQGQPVAFVHYRFEVEEGEAVLYCYEIQVAAAVQGKGLGKFLMQLLELIGRRSGVARLMLTVFHQNVAAVQLYRKLGYVLDADSPGSLDPTGDHKHEIMTKGLRQQGATQAS